eukprot:1491626-Rhodomonas_salina.2
MMRTACGLRLGTCTKDDGGRGAVPFGTPFCESDTRRQSSPAVKLLSCAGQARDLSWQEEHTVSGMLRNSS